MGTNIMNKLESIYEEVLKVSQAITRLETRMEERERQCEVHSKDISIFKKTLFGADGPGVGLCEKVRTIEGSNRATSTFISGGVSVLFLLGMTWIKDKFNIGG